MIVLKSFNLACLFNHQRQRNGAQQLRFVPCEAMALSRSVRVMGFVCMLHARSNFFIQHLQVLVSFGQELLWLQWSWLHIGRDDVRADPSGFALKGLVVRKQLSCTRVVMLANLRVLVSLG